MSASRRESGKTIIAFFSGTDYTFNSAHKGYVSQKEMGISSPSKAPPYDDNSFSNLLAHLNDNQERFGFDGCHTRGGGIYAFGIDEPANHLYQELKKQLADHHEKITLVLTAHSRGCLSALTLAKKISFDKEIKDKIDIVLDLRDPVPGNLKPTATLDIAGLTTIAGQLKNLSACKSIKKAYITVLEKGSLPVAFDVLIPQFSKETPIEVEYIPGAHGIQQDMPQSPNSQISLKDNYYLFHPIMYQLGLYKSLQIYAENNVSFIDYQNSLQKLYELHRESLRNLILQTDHSNHFQETITIQESLINRLNKLKNTGPLAKENYVLFLQEAQIELYRALLKDYKKSHTPAVQARQLHFGGEYKIANHPEKATHLNGRHAALENAHFPIILSPLPLLGFHGERETELAKKVDPSIEQILRANFKLEVTHLFQHYPLNEARDIINEKTKFFSREERIEIRRHLIDYQVKHAYMIYAWQMELKKPTITAKVAQADYKKYLAKTEGEARAEAYDRWEKGTAVAKKMEINYQEEVRKEAVQVASNEICSIYILDIKKMIEDVPSWKVGIIGGQKIRIADEIRLLPTHIALIYEQCLQAEKDKHWHQHFNEIAAIGLHASQNKPFTFFGLNKRDPQAQKIYDSFKELYEKVSNEFRTNRK